MSITQTVEIPVSHRLTIDVPPEVPTGQVKIIYFPISADKEPIQRSEARDIELFRIHAEELNAEAEDVLSYQIPIFAPLYTLIIAAFLHKLKLVLMMGLNMTVLCSVTI